MIYIPQLIPLFWVLSVFIIILIIITIIDLFYYKIIDILFIKEYYIIIKNKNYQW